MDAKSEPQGIGSSHGPATNRVWLRRRSVLRWVLEEKGYRLSATRSLPLNGEEWMLDS